MTGQRRLAGSAPLTVTTTSPWLSAAKKSADRRCLSRCLLPVLSELTSIVSRPVIAPSALTLPSPVTAPNMPCTVTAPQKCFTRNSTREPAGSSTHWPVTVPSANSASASAGATGPADPPARPCSLTDPLLPPSDLEFYLEATLRKSLARRARFRWRIREAPRRRGPGAAQVNTETVASRNARPRSSTSCRESQKASRIPARDPARRCRCRCMIAPGGVSGRSSLRPG